MRRLTLDKIASVTRNCALAREVVVDDSYPCREGDVVAVRVLTNKSSYNQLELPTGRFSQVKAGDVLVGALGHRRALLGYAGHLPTRLATGDRINLLNLGGVLGICDSANPDLGAPFECEVLGQVLHFPFLGERVGVPANIGQSQPPFEVGPLATQGVPVVAVVGTCMNAGKTFACTVLIQELVHAGLRVHAAKTTGVSLRRDVWAMEDAGAVKASSFTDLGIVTTTAAVAPALARTLLTRLSSSGGDRPDVIVLELGDGLLGSYGVAAILDQPDIRASFAAVVLAANDPVAAWGGVRRLDEAHALATTVVTGPATDNIAGTEVVEAMTGVPCANARTSGPRLAALVRSALDRWTVAGAGAGAAALEPTKTLLVKQEVARV
jgi:hypothetical protein